MTKQGPGFNPADLPRSRENPNASSALSTVVLRCRTRMRLARNAAAGLSPKTQGEEVMRIVPVRTDQRQAVAPTEYGASHPCSGWIPEMAGSASDDSYIAVRFVARRPASSAAVPASGDYRRPSRGCARQSSTRGGVPALRNPAGQGRDPGSPCAPPRARAASDAEAGARDNMAAEARRDRRGRLWQRRRLCSAPLREPS